jgi:hypothetical protein
MRFFVLEHPNEGEALTDFISGPGTKRGAATRCSKCGCAVEGLPTLPPIRVELETWGNQFGDLVFGSGDDVLVCERFRDEFLRSGMTGLFGFETAEIIKVIARRKKIPLRIPNYFLAIPGTSRAALDDKASQVEFQDPWTCDECRGSVKRSYQRVIFEPDTWSGEDVFIARGLAGVIVTTERFKRFCERHAFSNCLFIEAERYQVDYWRRHLPPGLSEPDTRSH